MDQSPWTEMLRRLEFVRSLEAKSHEYPTWFHNNVSSLDPSRLWLFDDQRLGRKEPNMLILGVDYHPSFQQIAFWDQETGECGERRLNHSDGEAEKFYRDLKQRGVRVRVGMEATGYSRWFERLLVELDIEIHTV
jgi:hypothetical protein